MAEKNKGESTGYNTLMLVEINTTIRNASKSYLTPELEEFAQNFALSLYFFIDENNIQLGDKTLRSIILDAWKIAVKEFNNDPTVSGAYIVSTFSLQDKKLVTALKKSDEETWGM